MNHLEAQFSLGARNASLCQSKAAYCVIYIVFYLLELVCRILLSSFCPRVDFDDSCQVQEQKHNISYQSSLRVASFRCCISKMAAEVRNEPDLPEEVTESLENFHQSLEKVEDAFKPLFESSREELREKVGLKLY